MTRAAKCPGCRSRRVVVVDRCCNYSAFSGYHWTASDYSRLRCLDCGTFWRTKARFVSTLPDATDAQATGVVPGPGGAS